MNIKEILEQDKLGLSFEVFPPKVESSFESVRIATEKIAELIKNGEIDEGIIKSLVGGLTGVTIGPSIGKAICKALGIEKGLLYDLFTSRIFTTAVAAYIGYKN